MPGFEAGFILGGITCLFLGLWLGGRSVLWRMHRDDVQGAHNTYQKRKEKYLKKS